MSQFSRNLSGKYCFCLKINYKEDIDIQKIQINSSCNFLVRGRKMSESSPVSLPLHDFHVCVCVCACACFVVIVGGGGLFVFHVN